MRLQDAPRVTQSLGRAGINPLSSDLPVVMDPLEHRAYCLQALQIEYHSLLYVLKSLSDISELASQKTANKRIKPRSYYKAYLINFCLSQ